MLDGAIVIPIQTLVWNFLFEIGALLWVVGRALLNVGYFVMALTGWVTQNAFAPLLQVVGEQTGVLVGPIFVLAITVLGFTYILAVFGRFEVVNLRSAVMWLLFAGLLYTLGPGLYTGIEDFRRLFGGGFYQIGVEAFSDASSATGISAIGAAPGDTVPVPVDQFGQFLPGVPGAAAVDGLDVAMAYVGADGFDVLAAPGSPHLIARLPWTMVENGGDGFFDPDTGPAAFGSMADADRQAAIGRTVQGVWRLFTVLFIAIFGIIEQLINFLMACSFAVAFFSMFIAVLFGFFRRTEPIAWGALNLIIELFIQSVINSLLLSLILGFVMVGANTANAILLLGSALVGLWMAWNLLHGCIKGLTGSTERLYKSFSAATGGHIATVSETNQTAVSAALGAATGASVLAGGGTLLQTLGATFGDSRTAQTMSYAARMLGGENTLMGSAAQQIGEGASARHLAGPLGGYLLGQQTAEDQRRAEYTGSADTERDRALQTYRRTGSGQTLARGFEPADIPHVQALDDLVDEAEFDMVVRNVRRVRNANPDLSPQSPAFTAKLRQALPATLQDIETPALADFARLYGVPPEPSEYQAALVDFTPPDQSAMKLGLADISRDQAVTAFRQAQSQGNPLPNLADAFSPEDANRVAQLIDAYDDDDFAALVYAVRAAHDDHPDTPPGSMSVLQAARQSLPPALKPTPSRDLAVFSRAFGGDSARPAIADPDTVHRPYMGGADADRDLVVEQVQNGDEDASVLTQAFPPREAGEIEALVRAYARSEFAAVVQAVRQARTGEPDLPPGSPQMLRATRKLLPESLKQMPSRDLTAFSRAFGAAADVPGIPADEDVPLLRRRAQQRRGSRSPETISADAAEDSGVPAAPVLPIVELLVPAETPAPVKPSVRPRHRSPDAPHKIDDLPANLPPVSEHKTGKPIRPARTPTHRAASQPHAKSPEDTASVSPYAASHRTEAAALNGSSVQTTSETQKPSKTGAGTDGEGTFS